MRRDSERLAFLGIDPANLEPAPDGPLPALDWWPRIDMYSPTRRRCSSCRALAVATTIVDVPGAGRRWQDKCRDCLVAGHRLNWEAGRPMEGRYRLTLASGCLPLMEGWWEDRSTADRKFSSWIGSYSDVEDARVTLVDEETGETLTTWPDEA